MIYLDNSATSNPKPARVREAVMSALGSSANPGRSGHALSMRAAEEIYKARTVAAGFFHAPKEENVIFTLNCTSALNIVMKGILKSGDHVVISDMEHNAVVRPLQKLAEKGITFSQAKVYPGDHDQTVGSFRSAVNAHTRMIICTHASNVWGVRLPVERLAALAHEYGLLIAVDAAQSAGIIPIDLTDSKIDFLCTAGHKGLYGPMGTGILIVCSENIPDSLTEGGTGTNSADLHQPADLPERLESGTPNYYGICGLRAGMEFIMQRRMETIAAHEYTLISALYRELKKNKHIRFYLPEPNPAYSAPILSFNIDGKDSEETAALLSRSGIAVRAGLHCAPLAHQAMGTLETGAVRISPSYFTSMAEIRTAAALINRISV